VVDRLEIAERRISVMRAAAERWQRKAPDVVATAELLARGGSLAASDPVRAASYVARENLKRAARHRGIGLERIIGGSEELDDVPPTVAARRAGRPVARIVELLDSNRVGEGFATGFVVAPGLLMTNWHVFDAAGDPLGCGAQFGYEKNDAGLLEAGVVFELDPEAFFLSSKSLDIALVGIKRAAAAGARALGDFGSVRLIPSQGKILVGHAVSIIQHPDGRHKHWAVRENRLVAEPKDEDLFISYTTDTLPGSSGSPAFNHDWELVALHHSGVPRIQNGEILTRFNTVWTPGMPDSVIDWVANEGVRVSKIHNYLKGVTLPDTAQQSLLAALVSASTDPVLTGEMAVSGPGLAIATDNMDANARDAGVMRVVVNGTANFFLGSQGSPPRSVQDARVTVTPATALAGALETALRFDPKYRQRQGYVSAFLPGFDVPPPSAPSGELLKDGNKVHVLRYHHYSLVMHKDRRLLMWAAANADYHASKRWRAREEFGSETWKPDPRVPIDAQIEDAEFYDAAKKFDRGHVVRRDDVAWGNDAQEEEFGNSDSFHWTNCTPQHEGFNRDRFGYHGIWGGLEHHVTTQAGFLQDQLIVFAGPVLDAGDPTRAFVPSIDVQVPLAFWKVIIAVEDAPQTPTLRAYGFILDQTSAIQQYGWEDRFKAGKFQEQQVSLATITDRSRVTFDQSLHLADPLANTPNEARRRPLRTLADMKLR
jgi:endonuclease G